MRRDKLSGKILPSICEKEDFGLEQLRFHVFACWRRGLNWPFSSCEQLFSRLSLKRGRKTGVLALAGVCESGRGEWPNERLDFEGKLPAGEGKRITNVAS